MSKARLGIAAGNTLGTDAASRVARAVLYAVSQPPHVDVNEMLIRPVAQTN